jgi:hypothetical protein
MRDALAAATAVRRCKVSRFSAWSALLVRVRRMHVRIWHEPVRLRRVLRVPGRTVSLRPGRVRDPSPAQAKTAGS